jgi:coproporphyrinogen III oxidase-like Fe-S oxidoreductase
LDLDLFTTQIGINAIKLFAPTIDRLEKMGLVERAKSHVKLTRQGIAVADAVAAEFLDSPL